MTLMAKNLYEPDEVMTFPNGGGGVVSVDSLIVGRSELQPGWRWSNDVAPITGGSSCQHPHTGVLLTGRMHIEMDDGTSLELRAGDVYVISSGHDGWVVGDEVASMVEWSGTAVHFLDPVSAG